METAWADIKTINFLCSIASLWQSFWATHERVAVYIAQEFTPRDSQMESMRMPEGRKGSASPADLA